MPKRSPAERGQDSRVSSRSFIPAPSKGHLNAEDLREGLQVTAVIEPLEGSSLPPRTISAKIDEVVRKGKADNGEETTNALKLSKKARVVGAYLYEIGKAHGGSIYARLGELFPEGYTPPTAARKSKQSKGKALSPFKNPDLIFEWTKKTKSHEFKWGKKAGVPKVAALPTKPFRLVDAVQAAKAAGSTNPQARGSHILRVLLKQDKIKVSEGGGD
jgi:hypothetical protein